MAKPLEGQTVSVEYTGSLEDGTVFDSNVGGDPLTFALGGGQVIPGFEEAVRDLEVGESVTTTIPPEKAYGEPRSDLVLKFSKDQFPDQMDPEVGMQVQLQTEQGVPIPATIVDVGEEAVTLDANHQLSGKTLVFDIKLLAVS